MIQAQQWSYYSNSVIEWWTQFLRDWKETKILLWILAYYAKCRDFAKYPKMTLIQAPMVLWLILGSFYFPGTSSQEAIYLLESYPSYSVVLPLTHETSFNETFVIQSPRFHRISAVIQFLNLPPKNDFSCGVFLQFQDGAELKSPKICGNFDPDEKSYAPSSLVGPRSYVSSRNSLRVSLLHGTAGKLDKVYARIAFTAFRGKQSYQISR